MAEIVNPRAGGAQGDSYYGLTGDDATLARLNVEINKLKGTLAANKPGTAKYKSALDAIKTAQAQQDAIRQKKTAVKSKKETKKSITKREELVDEVTRANDYGTPKEKTDAQTALDNFDDKNPAAVPPPVVTPKSSIKDSDKDGIPDTIDAKPTTPVKPAPKAKSGDKVVTPPPADGLDTKTLWVSYLRSTFASLEDKTQKAQIDKLLEDAKTFKYTEKTFMEILKGTIWWQTTLPSMRSFFLETSDPRNASTFTEKVQNKMSTIAAKLDTLGISAMSTDPATGKLIDNSEFIKGLAMQTIQNNWDDSQLEDFIATKSNVMFTGGGTLGSTLEKVKNQAYMYGVKIDSALEKEINFSLLDPNDGRDANYWLYSVKQQAMDSPTYKPFAESLKAGRSLYEVTNNYRQQMANLLEVDSTAITWDDLMGKVVDNTTGNARTFADFTKQVKQDQLWQYTKNAKETYSNMALDLARTFGFSG